MWTSGAACTPQGADEASEGAGLPSACSAAVCWGKFLSEPKAAKLSEASRVCKLRLHGPSEPAELPRATG